MKSYEECYNYALLPRVPIVLRLDGKNFSKLSKKLKLEKPFDQRFSIYMTETAKAVMSKIQGCMLGYTQSDEITLIIRTDQSDQTTPWFGNRIQKICSVCAGLASVEFSRNIIEISDTYRGPVCFDCRVMNVPSLVEAENNLIWRQNDCVKNSISTATYYELAKLPDCGKGTARKLMFGLNQDQQQELLFQNTGINWNDYYAGFRRGFVIYRQRKEVETPNGKAIRSVWTYKAAPIFTSEEGREVLSNALRY